MPREVWGYGAARTERLMLQIRLPRDTPNETERLNQMDLRALTMGAEAAVLVAYLLEEAAEEACLCRVVIALD